VPGYNIAHVDVTAKLAEEHNITYQDIDRIEAVVNWLETQYPSPAFATQRDDSLGGGEARRGSTRFYSAYGAVKRGFPLLAGTPDPPEVLELMKRVTIIPSHQMTLFDRALPSSRKTERAIRNSPPGASSSGISTRRSAASVASRRGCRSCPRSSSS
jgi:hypothetical protein